MNNHLRGLSLLYFFFSYAGVIVTLFESHYLFFKLFALGYASLLTFQLLNQYLDEN
jgi:hypothetical protein